MRARQALCHPGCHPGLLAVLLALILPSAGPQDPAGQEPVPITAFRQKERQRLEKELEGAWMLTSFETSEEYIDPRDIRGFASLHAGFMTLILQGREPVQSLLGGPDVEYTIQAGAYRYRVSENLTFQTASIMGYSNANPDGELEFDASGDAREYTLKLAGDELTLIREGGNRFVLSRLRSGAFPKTALDALDRARAGLDLGENDEGER